MVSFILSDVFLKKLILFCSCSPNRPVGCECLRALVAQCAECVGAADDDDDAAAKSAAVTVCREYVSPLMLLLLLNALVPLLSLTEKFAIPPQKLPPQIALCTAIV